MGHDELKAMNRSISGENKKMIVAVVDPAREGLHNEVIKTLRANESIQRLVYVSCNPTGTLVKDGAMLCAPPTKKYPGLPFRPSSAQPVDMFPLTPHCEMVMVFDRMTKDELFQKDMSKEDDKAATKQGDNTKKEEKDVTMDEDNTKKEVEKV